MPGKHLLYHYFERIVFYPRGKSPGCASGSPETLTKIWIPGHHPRLSEQKFSLQIEAINPVPQVIPRPAAQAYAGPTTYRNTVKEFVTALFKLK